MKMKLNEMNLIPTPVRYLCMGVFVIVTFPISVIVILVSELFSSSSSNKDQSKYKSSSYNRADAYVYFFVLPFILFTILEHVVLFYVWPYRTWQGYKKFNGKPTLTAIYNFMIHDTPHSDHCNDIPTPLGVPTTSICEKGVVGATGFQRLIITRSEKDIVEEFKRTGVIRLREINSTKLIVACGNVTTNERHRHVDAITINPHWTFNPTILGYFGLQKLPCIED